MDVLIIFIYLRILLWCPTLFIYVYCCGVQLYLFTYTVMVSNFIYLRILLWCPTLFIYVYCYGVQLYLFTYTVMVFVQLYLFTYTVVVSNSIYTSRYVRLRASNYLFDISSNCSHCKELSFFYKGLCLIHVVFRTG
jgi:hypothetical protein